MFNKRSIGIDISDKTIEAVELNRSGRDISVTSSGRAFLAPGTVEGGELKNVELMAEAFSKALLSANPSPIKVEVATLGLPERLYYTQYSLLPKTKDKDEIGAHISKDAQNNVPIPSENQVLGYKKIGEVEGGDSVEYLVVVCDARKINKWKGFFESQGVTINGFDPETLATRRSLVQAKSGRPYAVIDIGSLVTTISVFSHRGLRHSFFLPFAGEAIIDEIVSNMGITRPEAAELMSKADLSLGEDKITHAIVKVLEQIIKEFKYTVLYFERKLALKIDEVVLVGGTCGTGGIDKYFSDNLGINTVIGASLFAGGDLTFEYLEASGLALRKLVRDWDDIDPIIDEIEEKSFLDLFGSHSGYKYSGDSKENVLLPKGDKEKSNLYIEEVKIEKSTQVTLPKVVPKIIERVNPVAELIKKGPKEEPTMRRKWLVVVLAILVLCLLVVLVILAFTAFSVSYNKVTIDVVDINVALL